MLVGAEPQLWLPCLVHPGARPRPLGASSYLVVQEVARWARLLWLFSSTTLGGILTGLLGGCGGGGNIPGFGGGTGNRASACQSPISVSAGDDGGGSGSEGTSCNVGDRGAGSLTVVSVGTSASTPVKVGLGLGKEVGFSGSTGISVCAALGSGMATSPPTSCNAS